MRVPVRARGQQQSSLPATIPASVLGINAAQALSSMDPRECVYSFNISAGEYGMNVREGYAEWANGWTGGPAKTVMSFEGNVDTEDRLFVANNVGIWDVSTEGETSPTAVVTWPSSLNDAGVCSYVNFTNDGNERFLLVCDSENGYYRWTESTDTWVKYTEGAGANQIAGVDPALFNFVMIWKKRVWFIEKESANAWYLPVTTFEGTVVQFNFGDQFRSGGALVALHNWTLDGGDGVDDNLVAISGAGDVAVFQGTDPASPTTFGLIGTWYVGELPYGNRVASEYSGELYILSVQGVLPLSAMLNNSGPEDPKSYLTAKISPYIRTVLNSALGDFGWMVHVHPKKSLLYVNSPPRANFDQLSFTFYFGNSSWGMVRGPEMGHAANWQGEMYWSHIDENRLFIQQGDVDNVYIDSDEGTGDAINWDLLTAYQTIGDYPAMLKRVQFIRPMFIVSAIPAYNVVARYEYDISELTGSPAYGAGGAALWDTGLWDSGIWAGGAENVDVPSGGSGIGRHIAVNLRGRSAAETINIGFDIIYDTGGML